MFSAWILCGMEAALEDAPLSGGLSGNSNRNTPKRADSEDGITASFRLLLSGGSTRVGT